MRFATNYETRSRGVDSGSYSEERHFGARLVSSVAKTTRHQDGALYSFGATFPGHCCERNSIPARRNSSVALGKHHTFQQFLR